MDIETMTGLGRFGAAAALGLAAIGSSLGAGAAGPAAVGAWKKCLAQGKAAPFLLVTFPCTGSHQITITKAPRHAASPDPQRYLEGRRLSRAAQQGLCQ